jgi:hypothetical protein
MFGANRAPFWHRHTIHKRVETKDFRHDPSRLAVPPGSSKNISELVVHLGHSTISKWTETSFYLSLLVCSAQTVHLYRTKLSTISKQTKTSLHLSLVTYDYHRVHPKRFLSLWYLWRQPCTYLAPTLTPSLNGQK